MYLVRGSVAQQEHATQLGWLRVEVFILFEGDLYPAVHSLDRLRGGIDDLTLLQRKELGVGGRVAGEGQGEAAGSGAEDGLGRGWKRLGQPSVKAIKEGLPGRVRQALLCRDRQGKGQGGPARDANLAAHPPV